MRQKSMTANYEPDVEPWDSDTDDEDDGDACELHLAVIKLREEELDACSCAEMIVS